MFIKYDIIIINNGVYIDINSLDWVIKMTGIDTWIYDFCKYIDSFEIDEELKNKIKTLVTSDTNKKNMNKRIKNYYSDEANTVNNFFKYLYELKDKYDINYFIDAFTYSLDFEDEESNFIDQFIKFVTVTNFDEIEYTSRATTRDKNPSYTAELKLGGLDLCHIRELIYDEKRNILDFDMLHARLGLLRTKVGSKLLVELLKDMKTNYPNASLEAITVRRRNEKGINFYKKFGFLFFDNETNEIIDVVPENVSESVGVIISSDRIDECIKKNDNQYPTLELNGRIIDYNTYKQEEKVR